MINDKIDIVIVEPHHHALEHIHHVMRRHARKKRQVRSWTMVHFDSHPDLACPNHMIPARLCFTPRETKTSCIGMQCKDEDDNGTTHCEKELNSIGRNLYELLDTSQSGIAEWIIPLVFAGGLNTIYWLKNDWCNQFREGTYKAQVGAWIPSSERDILDNEIECFLDLPEIASVKTSLRHNYYLDDDSVVSENELLLKQEMNLIVSDLRTSQRKEIIDFSYNMMPQAISGEDNEGNKEWILDVCLDYFICSNPFIAELEDIDKNIIALIMQAVDELSFRKMAISSSSIIFDQEEAEKYRFLSKQFQDLAIAFFQHLSMTQYPSDGMDKFKYDLLGEQQYCDLYQLYDTPSIGEKIWDDLTTYLISLNSSRQITKLCEIIMNGLSSMALTLPHPLEFHEISPHLSPETQLKVELFGNDLRCHRWCNEDDGMSCPPSIITIARSSEDGFTPSIIVDELQKVVINQIHDVYCICKSKFSTVTKPTIHENGKERNFCKLNLVLDYGKYEGSTIG